MSYSKIVLCNICYTEGRSLDEFAAEPICWQCQAKLDKQIEELDLESLIDRSVEERLRRIEKILHDKPWNKNSKRSF